MFFDVVKPSLLVFRYLMDGAEDSSGSEMELGKDSGDEQETRRVTFGSQGSYCDVFTRPAA